MERLQKFSIWESRSEVEVLFEVDNDGGTLISSYVLCQTLSLSHRTRSNVAGKVAEFSVRGSWNVKRGGDDGNGGSGLS